MMDIASVTIGFLILLGAMTLGLHIATVMFGVGFIGAALYLGWPGVNAMVVVYLGSMDEAVLLQLPLFILLGEILVRCGATDRMYRSLADWLNPLPGGLLHTNVAASALFSAVSGSSVATAATISTVALPSFKKKSYDTRMVLGSIAAGGSLGNLIPPGIAFIIYGVLTNTSVARLYAGGVFPGVLLTVMFMATIVLLTWWRPSIAPREVITDPMLGAAEAPGRSAAAADHIRHRHGLDLQRLGDLDRGGGARRHRHAADRGAATAGSRSACCTTRSCRRSI